MIVKLAIGAYAIGALLTFGHVFNDNFVPPTPKTPQKECGAKPTSLGDGWTEYWDCRQFNIDAKYSGDDGTGNFTAGFPAAYAGLAWPIYWGAKIAIEVTKP